MQDQLTTFLKSQIEKLKEEKAELNEIKSHTESP
jgi:hypothetical protein